MREKEEVMMVVVVYHFSFEQLFILLECELFEPEKAHGEEKTASCTIRELMKFVLGGRSVYSFRAGEREYENLFSLSSSRTRCSSR